MFQRLCTYAAAFLAAAIVPAALAILFHVGDIEFTPIAFGVALAHALLLGLPIFLVFREKQWLGPLAVTAGGFVIGAIPIGLITWPLHPGSHFNASTGGAATIVEGVPTLAGWIEYLETLGVFALFGACGAFEDRNGALVGHWPPHDRYSRAPSHHEGSLMP